MPRLINWRRILVILLVGSLAPIGSLGIAKEAAGTEKSLTRKVESVKKDSPSSRKPTQSKKVATALLASATKPRQSKEVELSNEQPSIPAEDLQGAKLDLVDEKDLPTPDSISPNEGKLTIGATARVQEAQSEMLFLARVDTGAASCSMHCEKWKIDDESDSMEENIGKDIRVLISNDEQESQWVDSRIEHCVVVKTSEEREMRYKVPMTLRWNDFEKEVVVTLNNRGHMNFPLLLGRNFLEGDFVVDIEMVE